MRKSQRSQGRRSRDAARSFLVLTLEVRATHGDRQAEGVSHGGKLVRRRHCTCVYGHVLFSLFELCTLNGMLVFIVLRGCVILSKDVWAHALPVRRLWAIM